HAGALAARLDERGPREGLVAAYLGAPDGDAPGDFALFAPALSALGVGGAGHIPAAPTDHERAPLPTADLVLPSGCHLSAGRTALARANPCDPQCLDGGIWLALSPATMGATPRRVALGIVPSWALVATAGAAPPRLRVVEGQQENELLQTSRQTTHTLVRAGA